MAEVVLDVFEVVVDRLVMYTPAIAPTTITTMITTAAIMYVFFKLLFFSQIKMVHSVIVILLNIPNLNINFSR